MLVTPLLPSRDLRLKGSSQRLSIIAALGGKAGPGKRLHLWQNMLFMNPSIGGFFVMPKVSFFFPPTSTYLLFVPNSFQHKSQFTLAGHIFKGKNMFLKEPYEK